MTEADFEYLIHTLSEARSRAAEIALAVRGRAGADHRLAQLADAAVSKIEGVLTSVRQLALERSASSFRAARETERKAPAKPFEVVPAATGAALTFTLPSGIGPEHWLYEFLRDVFRELGARGGVTIEYTDRMWKQRKDVYAQDRDTARRMVRTYPGFFPELTKQASGHASGRSA